MTLRPNSRRAAIVAALVVLSALATPVAAQAAHFEPVVVGMKSAAPIDRAKLVSAITTGLAQLNWRVVKSESGRATAVYEKSGGKINATIALVYDDTGYRIEYVSSKNLDADVKAKTIHRNYMRWINNLIKVINATYPKS